MEMTEQQRSKQPLHAPSREEMAALVEGIRAPRGGRRVQVKDLKFPTTNWVGQELRDVDFVRCDLTNLALRTNRSGSVTVRNCTFEDVDLPSLRKAAVAECRFVRGGFINFRGLYDCVVTDSRFDRCRFESAQIQRSTLRNVVFDHIRLEHPHFSRTTLVDTAFIGQAKTAIFTECVFDGVDFSALHMHDSIIRGDFRSTSRFPQFTDSFVVRHEALVSVEPDLLDRLRPNSLHFYRGYVTKFPKGYAVIDDETFVVDIRDFADAMTPDEAHAVVASLYRLRCGSTDTLKEGPAD